MAGSAPGKALTFLRWPSTLLLNAAKEFFWAAGILEPRTAKSTIEEVTRAAMSISEKIQVLRHLKQMKW